jgi:hypothetical protein
LKEVGDFIEKLTYLSIYVSYVTSYGNHCHLQERLSMKIWSNTITTINGIKIFPGESRIDIDHKDPTTAQQLRVLRRCGLIDFKEILDGDPVGPEKNDGPVRQAEKITDNNISNRDVPDEAANESAACCDVAERRDGKYQTRKIRRKSRTKKQKVDERD